jgi:hypothetical protein
MGNCMCDKKQIEFHESLFMREEDESINTKTGTQRARQQKKQKYENEALDFIYNSEKNLNNVIKYTITEKSELA